MTQFPMATNSLLFVVMSFAMTSCQDPCTWQSAPTPVPNANCHGSSQDVVYPAYNDQRVACDQDMSGQSLDTPTPTLHWSGVDPTKTYLIVMVDPDASTPCNPSRRFVLHWAAFARGRELTPFQTFASYRGPHPPAGGSAHRYQLYLFVWDSNPALVLPDFLGHDSQNRASFDFDRFKTVNGLGNPVADFQFLYHN